MALRLITPPAAEPITVEEAKIHCKASDQPEEDPLIMSYIEAGRQYFEGRDGVYNLAIMTQTWELTLPGFPYATSPSYPGWAPIEIPLPPLQSVDFIKYIDGNGFQQTWAPENYVVNTASRPGCIYPAAGSIYPPTRYQPDAVTTQFVAGYGSKGADVPAGIRLALSALVAHFYENREPVLVGPGSVSEIPMHVKALMAPFKTYTKDSF